MYATTMGKSSPPRVGMASSIKTLYNKVQVPAGARRPDVPAGLRARCARPAVLTCAQLVRGAVLRTARTHARACAYYTVQYSILLRCMRYVRLRAVYAGLI